MGQPGQSLTGELETGEVEPGKPRSSKPHKARRATCEFFCRLGAYYPASSLFFFFLLDFVDISPTTFLRQPHFQSSGRANARNPDTHTIPNFP
ncbi:uncharacterized protein FMAN_07572 [Fusarium mangiferae]|uniref:Uncharacterized protein n=1 Tax=Fusarium mangiferae TaxID=192010 RepID=A0A1L7T7I6_FUSMA|nr:uncharacterized protein FMAN_07572 [Fusarium mangiferae]CVK92692.1 uncharacterized protein FMAN_07572 [Fusarium mangiferae]